MIAFLQRILVAWLLAFCLTWAALAWDRSVWLALAAPLFLLAGQALFLAVEFGYAWSRGRDGAVPRPGLHQLIGAWLAEIPAGLRVFLWRQPFREHAYADWVPTQDPDRPVRGVVLVPGFLCNRGFWNPWLKRLRAEGRPFVAVSPEPPFGGIDAYVPQIEEAVRRIELAGGQAPLLIAHSMGGLAARAWLQRGGNHERVDRVVTIGTPHQGCDLARFSFTVNGSQMVPGSEWLRRLHEGESASQLRRLVCYYSNSDNVVFPADLAVLPGADNRLLPGRAHIELAFDGTVMREALDARPG